MPLESKSGRNFVFSCRLTGAIELFRSNGEIYAAHENVKSQSDPNEKRSLLKRVVGFKKFEKITIWKEFKSPPLWCHSFWIAFNYLAFGAWVGKIPLWLEDKGFEKSEITDFYQNIGWYNLFSIPLSLILGFLYQFMNNKFVFKTSVLTGFTFTIIYNAATVLLAIFLPKSAGLVAFNLAYMLMFTYNSLTFANNPNGAFYFFDRKIFGQVLGLAKMATGFIAFFPIWMTNGGLSVKSQLFICLGLIVISSLYLIVIYFDKK